MASKQQQRKQQRIVTQRVEALEQLVENMPATIVQFLMKHNEFSTIFDSIKPVSGGDQHFDAIPGTLQPVVEIIEQAKPMESRNTPEKKHNRQDWCYRLVVIRSECNVAVDDLTTHRADTKERNNNWNAIERAAKTVVIEDNSKQDLPLVGMPFVYAARLRMKVLELEQVAQVEHNSVASLYESRAASLLALMREIKTAHGNKFSANPDW